MLRLKQIGGIFLALCSLAIAQNDPTLVEAAYPPGFQNQTGCLYAYTQIEGSTYEIFHPEGADSHMIGHIKDIKLDPKSTCIDGATPGSLKLNLAVEDMVILGMTLDLKIRTRDKEHNWEISEAKLSVQWVQNTPVLPAEMYLKSARGDMYAGLKQSYSCSSLVLQHREPTGNQIKLTLRRFQVQPFHEPASYVFAPSHDCSTWLTLPQIMGFLLVLFIIFTVLLGVYLLIELGGHSSDLRFSKQGGMLMNQAQLDATKAD